MEVGLYCIDTPKDALQKVSWSYIPVPSEKWQKNQKLVSRWSVCNGTQGSHDNYYCLNGIIRRESKYHPQDEHVSFFACGNFDCPQNKQNKHKQGTKADWYCHCSECIDTSFFFSDEEWESIRSGKYEIVESYTTSNPPVEGIEKEVLASYDSGGIGFKTTAATVVYRNGLLHDWQLSPSTSWDDWKIIRAKL